ncbi:MAG: hypothetical protein HYZ58_00275 [Acidobacteria bacterium]|nr:hypothetical protein [Acidobacteriota bacterium]
MLNWRRINQLAGESIREIGILVFVFTPLDAAFDPGRIGAGLLAMVMLFALGLIIAGTMMESME